MADKDFPVGVAQKRVLDTLGLSADNYDDACRKFFDLGIVVASKRGVPVVWLDPRTGDFAEKAMIDSLSIWIKR